MGDWTERADGSWAYDTNAPAPSPEVTQIRPSTQVALDAIHGSVGTYSEVQRREVGRVLSADEPDEHADLTVVDPDEFPWFDEVDSRMIRTIGAPE